MAAQKKQKQINLLPQEEFAASPLGRVVTWLMSTFRVIVIFTEMVVMLAFLSRFWLDTQITDLDDKIKINQVRIQAFSTFEKTWRGAQARLSIFSQLTTDANSQYPVVGSVSAFMPTDISLSSFSITGGVLQIKGVGFSEQSISQFLVNLENAGRFEEVELTQVDSNEDASIVFTIRAKVKTPPQAGGGGT